MYERSFNVNNAFSIEIHTLSHKMCINNVFILSACVMHIQHRTQKRNINHHHPKSIQCKTHALYVLLVLGHKLYIIYFIFTKKGPTHRRIYYLILCITSISQQPSSSMLKDYNISLVQRPDKRAIQNK